MNQDSNEKPERTTLNAAGDFYVIKDTCLACMVPEYEAPELMGYDDQMGCYFRRQPQTLAEREHAINAVRGSCIEALRYGGDDPEILKALRANHCGHLCDKTMAES
jgi:hypothetical protein